MLSEMARAVRIGGTVAAYVWDYANQMQLIGYFWNAVALDKMVLALDEGQRFPLCQPEPLRQLFQTSAQLENIEIRAIDVPTIFRNFETTGLHSLVAKALPLAIQCPFLKHKESLFERYKANTFRCLVRFNSSYRSYLGHPWGM
jgi:hypothetical protein